MAWSVTMLSIFFISGALAAQVDAQIDSSDTWINCGGHELKARASGRIQATLFGLIYTSFT
jgi:hypothetical protein